MARPKDLIVTMIGSYPTDLGTAVADQLEVGLNLITDGQTRADMIRLFAERIPGLMMEKTPQGEKAIITGHIKADVAADELVADLVQARDLARGKADVKAIVTGPVTMAFSSELRTSAYKNYRDPRLYNDMAGALLHFAKAFRAAGATRLQIDEPFLSVGAPMREARAAIEHIAKGSGIPEVALHVCGDVSAPMPDGTGGSVALFHQLLDFEGIGILSHGFMGQSRNRNLIDKAHLEDHGKRLGLGCIDTAKHDIESPDEVSSLIRDAVDRVGWENLVIHPDCGLRSLPHAVAKGKLKAMVAGLMLVDR